MDHPKIVVASAGEPCMACPDGAGHNAEPVWIERTGWRNRLLFNTWRKPFPYLLHRWDVVGKHGWCGGFWTRARAGAWVDEYRRI